MWGPGAILVNEIDLVPILTALLPSREGSCASTEMKGDCAESCQSTQALLSVAFVFLRMPGECLIQLKE